MSAARALFLDRDGVLIDYVPYLSRPEQVTLPDGAAQALRRWQEAGFALIIITNQAGIGRGYFALQDMEAVHERIQTLYGAEGVSFTDIFYCPHAPQDGCQCRKPSPWMLRQAAARHGLSLADSYFLGDAPSDLEAALNAGCRPLLALTGRGRETQRQLSRFPAPIPVFEQVKDTASLLELRQSH
ncbi:MAG: D-glycero-alpha-D-manno-heptose-1,7-bisphosphate 7-phosphatase [Cyanobacteriota bacterium]|jgi:D-glycero-D-manno-heptose 1,7-bisphosphate phosphatase